MFRQSLIRTITTTSDMSHYLDQYTLRVSWDRVFLTMWRIAYMQREDHLTWYGRVMRCHLLPTLGKHTSLCIIRGIG